MRVLTPLIQLGRLAYHLYTNDAREENANHDRMHFRSRKDAVLSHIYITTYFSHTLFFREIIFFFFPTGP